MKEHSHDFDTKGFKFFLKFSVCFLGLSFAAYYGTQFFMEKPFAPIHYREAESLTSELRLELSRQRVSAESALNESGTTTLAFVGDVMLDRGIELALKKYADGDYSFPFEKIQKELGHYELLFGNLEGPLSDKGKDAGSTYSFRMSLEALPALERAGFDIVSVANNHMGDWGQAAMEDTFARLSASSIEYVGGAWDSKGAYMYKTVDTAAGKIAFLALSQFGRGYLEAGASHAGIAIISKEAIQSAVQKAKAAADIVVVSLHFGDEYETVQNDFQEEYAHFAIAQGADLVVGHHPHVAQPVEKYHSGYIAYSLGNFIFDQNFSEDTAHATLLEVDIQNGDIVDVRERMIGFTEKYQPFFMD